jgi:hypothetical protein
MYIERLPDTGCEATDRFLVLWQRWASDLAAEGRYEGNVRVDRTELADVLPYTCPKVFPSAVRRLADRGIVLHDADGGPVTRETRVISFDLRRDNPASPKLTQDDVFEMEQAIFGLDVRRRAV